jgi:hypothetical protein
VQSQRIHARKYLIKVTAAATPTVEGNDARLT